MLLRAVLPASAVVVTAVLCLGAAEAPADALFTSTNHTTRVSVGTTASIAAGTVTAKTGSTVINHCTGSTLDLTLEENTTSQVSGTLTSGTFTGCKTSAAGDFPWRFTVRGSGVASGTSTVFTNTTWEDVSATLWGVSPGNGTLTDATGLPPTNGIYVREAAGSGSSICFVLNDAGTLSGPLLSDGKIDATYCMEGSGATAWSLGATALPPVADATATLFTTGAHTARVTVGATGRLTGAGLGFTSGGTLINVCGGSSLTFQLTQNNTASSVQGTITSGSFSGCSTAYTLNFTTPWAVAITGGRQANGTTLTYPNATLKNIRYDYLGNTVTGALTAARSSTATGLYAAQPTVGGAPVCLVMNHAGTVSDPLFGPLNLDGQWCFDSEPSKTWSLT
jgi:hypothetical protein